MTDADEHELIAFLSDPRTHPGPPAPVDVVETHAARVFLAGDRAIKIKKRVHLPFLDFTTLALRHQALKRELDLNAPHAPDIYRELASIGRAEDGTLAFGVMPALDYALIMTRFDQGDVLARRAEEGPLTGDLAKALAGMVARYHAALPPVTGASGARIMCATVEQVALTLTADAPPPLADPAADFARTARAEVARLASLLDARSSGGAVRRCHGDLHLGNIVLIDGAPVAFDALEFDESMATIDVLYDLAFLLMDLDVRGDRAAANAVLNTYVASAPAGGELEGLAALPLFLATRAAIRGFVACERAAQSAEACSTCLSAADVSIRAANAYLAPERPRLIAVGGLSGTGKSTLAARLAADIGPAPGALVLRTDVERKRMFDVPETERLSADHYTEALSDEIYAALYAKAARVLAAGHSVIFDGVSSKPAERDSLAETAASAGVAFHGLWLEAPLETQLARIAARRNDASDATAAVVRAQHEQDVGPLTWTRIDAGRSLEETLAQARAALGLPSRDGA